MNPLSPVSIKASAYRVPIDEPVRTAFGTLHDRPGVLVRVTDADGQEGWGESWCNFPSVGAEHRARLINHVVGPLLTGRSYSDPRAAFAETEAALRVMAIQSGEPGPLAQALAGIDMAMWDLLGQRTGTPLHRLLNDSAVRAVPVYASGINPDAPERLAAHWRDRGHRAFKLKIGFAAELDRRNLRAMRAELGADAMIAVDANQAYGPDEALATAENLADQDPAWLEEPMPADTPWPVWRQLADTAPVPLAGGENLRGEQFDQAMESKVFRVLQPDIGKWGGLSGNLEPMRRAIAAGLTVCPHWLAGGIGLVASLHFLAAVGGPGLLEVDINPNPLRDLLCGDHMTVRDGHVTVPEEPGIGVIPDLDALERYRTL